MDEESFARVVEQGKAAQQHFSDLGLVAVGGTATAVHCHHRFSLDVDLVTPHLQRQFERIAMELETWEGWTTNRMNPPVLILGQRYGVEVGLRQQRRAVPLHTVEKDGLLIPTAKEMLRVKAFLLAQRRATRDYVDVAALALHLGPLAARQALSHLQAVYPAGGAQTLVTRFAEACEAEPLDLSSVPLATYKGLQPPFTDWPWVAAACQRLGRELLRLELNISLPSELTGDFYQEDSR